VVGCGVRVTVGIAVNGSAVTVADDRTTTTVALSSP
jgi:hypothetical protein